MISPRLFAHALNTRNGALLIDAALRTTPGTPQGFAVATRLAGFLKALNQEIEDRDAGGRKLEEVPGPSSAEVGAELGGMEGRIPRLKR